MKLTHIWVLGVSPLVWSVHFVLSYVTAAVWCAKFFQAGDNLHKVRLFFTIYTVLALIVVVRETVIGYKNHKFEDSPPPHDDDTHEDRERFLGLARFLISSLSLIAIIYTSYVGYFFRSCW